MASSLTSGERPSLPAPGDTANDPFVAVAATKTHHRYSDFDQGLFAAGPGSSPTQARLALEAHLAETDRRLDEAGKLGTALVSQRKALAEQLHEVEQLQAEGQMGPELRKKLVEIEREYNDVARELARVFLPKQRVPSNETNPGSPYVPEARSGRRSVSPSKFESHATGSPTKLNVPNRRSRNQPTNRVHDIEFAAEISTSLIAQVRNLQSLLSERDEENKTLRSARSKLEIEAENLQQRLRALDESEHRYKEENWNLETRLQELSSQQREAADREKRLTQALGITNADKTATQKELDEVKLSHSKLAEEHAAVIKHHDIELGTVKRTMVIAEGERTALQRKIDDLTSQNQELAKAFSLQRGRATDREPASGTSDDDFDTAADNMTPEHSPPPSPIKGTPRHAVLETETVKTSLQHAQRTIQSQRNQLHREKTERLELRRIIQDLRDDLEKVRTDAAGAASNRRSRRVESKDLKKSQRLLGTFRSSRHEILVDEPEWEDNADGSPGTASAGTGPSRGAGMVGRGDASDQFETANEASESAFETANERATETDDFQTGHEELSGSDKTETETEGPSRSFGRMRRPPSLPAGLVRQRSRGSFMSTASTSADEADSALMRTPTASLSSQRSRLRLGRGGSMSRGSRQTSEEPSFRSSPASFASGGTPQAGQSLFAELQDLGGSDESGAGTPCRRSTRSFTPGSFYRNMSPPPAVPKLPKVVMVDSGVMTDPVKITTDVFGEWSTRPTSMESVVNAPGMRPSTAWRDGREADTIASRPLSIVSYGETGAQSEQELAEELAQFPVPPTSSPFLMPPTPLVLAFSSIHSLDLEPRAEVQTPPTPPTLGLTSLSVQQIEPLPEPEVPLPSLCLSTIMVQGSEPVAESDVPRPQLTMAPVLAQVVDPVATPFPSLALSSIFTETVEPIAEPDVPKQMPAVMAPALPDLIMSIIRSEHVEPVSEPNILVTSPSLTLSTIQAEQLEPGEVPELFQPLGFSDILAEHVEPVSEQQPAGPTLALSSIVAQHTHPITEPPPSPAVLVMSSIASEHVEPVASCPLATPTLPSFDFTDIETVETRPLSPRSPRRDGFILPRDDDFCNRELGQPGPPYNNKALGLALGRGKNVDFVPMISEDETSQTLRDAPEVETLDSQRPFKKISSNSNGRQPRKQSDQGAQTSLTSSAIDKLLSGEPQVQGHGHVHHASISPMGSPDTTGTVRIHRWQENLDSPIRGKGLDDTASETTAPPFRPGSAASGKESTHDVPPLPSNHRQLIDAARSGSVRSNRGTMGPPLWPASAMKQQRPHTPIDHRPSSAASVRATAATPRFTRGGSAHGTAEIHSPSKLVARSRKSSVSSFASELDTRFNICPGEMGMGPVGFGPDTDPRMIQAITQTMIGEFLWKYTRKPGRVEMSENRHRRYFWVHPYTRTLYWSDRDPSSAGRTELRAKSVPIEAVRVASDDNPMPPGLHRKSLIIISPGRTIKFTCTTGQRHETWFNALSYLLLRTDRDGQSDAEEMAKNITHEDVDEFHPRLGRRPTNGNQSETAPPSLSSYHSRTTRNEIMADGASMEIPTLTPANHSRQAAASRTSAGALSKLSGYWKACAPKLSGTFSSLRGRGSSGQPAEVYEASEVHDSAEDLREMIERQDRDAYRLENVRACCDGKHDVGTLTHSSRRGRSQHAHSHAVPSSASVPMASARPRA